MNISGLFNWGKKKSGNGGDTTQMSGAPSVSDSSSSLPLLRFPALVTVTVTDDESADDEPKTVIAPPSCPSPSSHEPAVPSALSFFSPYPSTATRTIPLRPYQQAAIDAGNRDFAAGERRLLFSLPTGAGKTIIFCTMLMERLRENPSLRGTILAHTNELIGQSVDKMKMVWPKADIGIVKAERNELDRQITVASVQSLHEGRLKTLPAQNFLITDESHRAPAASYQRIYDHLTTLLPGNTPIGVNPEEGIKSNRAQGWLHLGVTATPFRADKQGLGTVFDKVSYQISIKELIEQGYLCNLRGLQFKTEVSLQGVTKHDGDFSATSLSKLIDLPARNRLIVEKYGEHANGRKAIAFCANVAHAKHLSEEFKHAGFRAEVVWGEMPEKDRRQVLADFKAGNIEIVSNCLDEKTEILTKKGWKNINTIEIDDETATFNLIDSQTIEWQKISRIVRRKRSLDERMVIFKNQSLDIRVTEGHRIITRASRAEKWKVIEAKDIFDFKGSYELPLSGFAKFFEGVPLKDEELEFLGLFATDGSLNVERASIEIAQASKSFVCLEIERILTACNFDWKVTEATIKTTKGIGTYKRYRIPKGTIGGQLKRNGWGRLSEWIDKSLSPKLKNCTPHQFEKLLHGLWLGDGLKDFREKRKNPGIRICGIDTIMFDRLQAWAVCRGFATNLTVKSNTSGGRYPESKIWILNLRKRFMIQTNNQSVPTSGGNPASFENEWKNEEVWCVTNQNGTIVTRRNGKVVIMGQCGILTEGFDEPSVSCIISARPTQSLPLFCLDLETQILTKNGWKNHDDVSIGDMVAGFDPSTEEIKWTFVKSKIVRPLQKEEQMISYKSPHLDFRVSNKHRLLYRVRYGRSHRKSEWKFIEAEELQKRSDGFDVPVSGLQNSKGLPFSDDEIRFIGWSLTDGHLNKSTNAIAITQAEHQPYNENIRSMLEGCGFKYSVYRHKKPYSQFNAKSDRLIYSISKGKPRGRDKHLSGWKRLESYIDKNFSPELEEISQRQLGILLETMHFADGAKQAGESWTYHIGKANLTMLERLQSLCVRRGYRCNISSFQNEDPSRKTMYTLHISEEPKNFRILGGQNAKDRASLKISDSQPNEMVWCIENEMGTLITRRNGTVLIMGNCQIVGRGTRIAPDKTDCLVLDFVDNVGRNKIASLKDLTLNAGMNSRAKGERKPRDLDDDEDVDENAVYADLANIEIRYKGHREVDLFLNPADLDWRSLPGVTDVRFCAVDQGVSLMLCPDPKKRFENYYFPAILDHTRKAKVTILTPFSMPLADAADLACAKLTEGSEAIGNAKFLKKNEYWKNQQATKGQLDFIEKLGGETAKRQATWMDAGQASAFIEHLFAQKAKQNKMVTWLNRETSR